MWRRRYYLAMSSLALVVALLSSAAAALSGHLGHHLSIAFPRLILILVVINLVGAYFLFRPVARFLDDTAEFESAQRRIRRLPLLSGSWAFVLTLLFMMPTFYEHHLRGSTPFPDLLLLYPLALITLYSLLMGLYLYFFIGDYVARLRESLFYERQTIVQPDHARFRRRLLVAFIATSVVPVSVVLLHALAGRALREQHGLDSEQAYQLNLLAAVFLVSVAIVFVTRNLTRPVKILSASLKRIEQGESQARAPVVSDDEMGTLTVQFNKMAEGLEERDFVRATLGRFVPPNVAESVLKDRGVLRPQVREATILFSDIEGFTSVSENLAPEQVIALLNDYFRVAAEPIHAYGGVITQFQGDAMLVSFNLPVEDADHAANALRAAQGVQSLLENRRFLDGIALPTRIGINTGLVVGGTVGDGERLGYTVHGDVVNLAARLEQLNKRYGTRVLVSQKTADLAGSGFGLRSIGEATIRGRESAVTIYELLAAPPS